MTKMPRLVVQDPARDPGLFMIYRAERAEGCHSMTEAEIDAFQAKVALRFKDSRCQPRS